MLSPIMSQILDPGTHQPRSRMFWIVLGGLVVAQLFALWMLCSQQVRKAEARRVEAQVQQLALADCLRYVAGSTIASCSGRPSGAQQPRNVENSLLSQSSPPGAYVVIPAHTPVSFNYR